MITLINLKSISLGNFVYNTKVNQIAEVISVSEDGIISKYFDESSKMYLKDEKPHFEFDLIAISIPLVYNILNLDLHFEEDKFSSYYPYDDYYDKTHQIRLTDGHTDGWFLHIDNSDFDSIGSGHVMFINEIQNILNNIGFNLDEFVELSNNII